MFAAETFRLDGSLLERQLLMTTAEVLNSVTPKEPLASISALAVTAGIPETVGDDNVIGLGLVAPHASNAADVDSLDDDAKMEISVWLVTQSDKAFKGSKVFEALGEARSYQTVAMLALDLALFPKKDWDMALRARDINPENVKYKYVSAKAVAAALGLDPRAEDDKVRDKAQRDIDRLSPSVDWLMNKILAMTMEERKTITFDDAGIAALVQVLKNKGLTEAAKAQRDFSNTPEAERGLKIEISANQGHDVLVKAGKQALCSQAGSGEDGIEPEIVVLAEIGGKQIPVPLDQKLLRAIRDHVFAAAAPVDPAVDMLGELLQIGKMVEERETNLPTNDIDDPKDPSTKKRLTTRHFVLRPDKSVLISPILAEGLGSPVVVAKLPDFIVDVPEGELLELETRGRRKAEANIADPSRRRFSSPALEQRMVRKVGPVFCSPPMRQPTRASGLRTLAFLSSPYGRRRTTCRSTSRRALSRQNSGSP